MQAVVVGLAATAGWAPVSGEAVEEWFSTGLYPVIQRHLTPIANALPFAWLDLLALTAFGVAAVMCVRAIHAARATRRISPLLRAGAALTTTAAAVYLTFLMLWGLNYRRVPMSDRLVVETGAPTADAVLALGMDAATNLNALHSEAHRAGWPSQPLEDESLRRAFVAVQRLLTDEAGTAIPGRLKETLFGSYFRWSGVDGMINPFGLEVLANPDLLPFERPFIAAHEWSHLAGFADESEASFVGWLMCMRGSVPAQYSGWLFLYWQVNGELDASSRGQLADGLDEGPRHDLNAIVERLRRGQRAWVRVAGWRVYDQYLKANRVEEGVRSYDAVVTLILRARFDPGWTPVRRIVR